MPRLKYKTLTEQMFYILLCLTEERRGMEILKLVPEITEGRVSVGSATLYNLLESFLEEGLIRETRAEGRWRSYILTKAGEDRLGEEYQRISAQAQDYRIYVKGEKRE